MGTIARQVNIHDAKTHLSRLLERVEQGGEIVITRGGRPIARLLAICGELTLRQPGALRGRIQIADDFDAPLPPEVLGELLGTM